MIINGTVVTNNSFDDEQWSYLYSSAPDYVKHKRVCQRDDDSTDDNRL